MTPDQLDALDEVNRQVNAIPYQGQTGPTEPVDFWDWEPAPSVSWVCRDYTLRKAELLRESGFDPTWMTIILCFVETGEYHAVLGVTEGDWRSGEPTTILDSRFADRYAMTAPPPGYRWDRRQVPGTEDFVAIA